MVASFLWGAVIVGGLLIFILTKWGDGLLKVVSEDENRRKVAAGILVGYGSAVTFGWGAVTEIDNRTASHEKEIVDKIDSSIEKLGVDDYKIRMAAISTISQLSSNNQSVYEKSMMQIVIYVREKGAILHYVAEQPFRPKPIGADVQAAIDALGWRNSRLDRPERALNLSGVRLVRPNFHATQGFSKALFSGATLLAGDFRYANLEGTDFRGAEMNDYMAFGVSRDHVDAWDDKRPDRPDWKSWERYIYAANFEGANLTNANFDGARLVGALFVKANLSGTSFVGANLTRADFTGALNIDKANFDAACGADPIGLGRKLRSC